MPCGGEVLVKKCNFQSKKSPDDEPIAVFQQRFAVFWSFMAVEAVQKGRKSKRIQAANRRIWQKI
jgi:hypothetical protein